MGLVLNTRKTGGKAGACYCIFSSIALYPRVFLKFYKMRGTRPRQKGGESVQEDLLAVRRPIRGCVIDPSSVIPYHQATDHSTREELLSQQRASIGADMTILPPR